MDQDTVFHLHGFQNQYSVSLQYFLSVGYGDIQNQSGHRCFDFLDMFGTGRTEAEFVEHLVQFITDFHFKDLTIYFHRHFFGIIFFMTDETVYRSVLFDKVVNTRAVINKICLG